MNSKLNPSGKGFLDFKHLSTNGAFELKPNNLARVTSGIAQLDDYIASNPGLTLGINEIAIGGLNQIILFGTVG